MVNPNAGQEGQNDFIAIDKSDRDAYMRGDQGAQDLKSKYVDAIKADGQKLTDTAPENFTSAAQSPSAPIDTAGTTDISYQQAPAGYGDDINLKFGLDKKKNFFNK